MPLSGGKEKGDPCEGAGRLIRPRAERIFTTHLTFDDVFLPNTDPHGKAQFYTREDCACFTDRSHKNKRILRPSTLPRRFMLLQLGLPKERVGDASG